MRQVPAQSGMLGEATRRELPRRTWRVDVRVQRAALAATLPAQNLRTDAAAQWSAVLARHDREMLLQLCPQAFDAPIWCPALECPCGVGRARDRIVYRRPISVPHGQHHGLPYQTRFPRQRRCRSSQYCRGGDVQAGPPRTQELATRLCGGGHLPTPRDEQHQLQQHGCDEPPESLSAPPKGRGGGGDSGLLSTDAAAARPSHQRGQRAAKRGVRVEPCAASAAPAVGQRRHRCHRCRRATACSHVRLDRWKLRSSCGSSARVCHAPAIRTCLQGWAGPSCCCSSRRICSVACRRSTCCCRGHARAL